MIRDVVRPFRSVCLTGPNRLIETPKHVPRCKHSRAIRCRRLRAARSGNVTRDVFRDDACRQNFTKSVHRPHVYVHEAAFLELAQSLQLLLRVIDVVAVLGQRFEFTDSHRLQPLKASVSSGFFDPVAQRDLVWDASSHGPPHRLQVFRHVEQ